MNKKIHLKVCGMRDPDNIIQVGELHPDYMGFIFYSKSKRYVGDDFVIPDQLPRSIKRVGVFVNEVTEKIIELSAVHQLDFIQMHGNEPVEQCMELKGHGLGVIKVFQISPEFNFSDINPYKKAVDYFLFDTKSDSYGGAGKTFDWTLLNGYDQEVPFFLSGGLSVENIQRINSMQGMNLHSVDINSGVETEPGIKEIDSVLKFKVEMDKSIH